MSLSFPPSPSVGQAYQQFKWDGAKWVPNPAAVPGLVTSVDGVSGAVTTTPFGKFIQSQTASASASIAFALTGNYKRYKLIWDSVLAATASQKFYLQCSDDGGATWKSAANYVWVGVYGVGGGTP